MSFHDEAYFDHLKYTPIEPCAFCDGQHEATHFNTEWDAPLCDECADAQDRMVAEAKKIPLGDIFPGLGEV